MTKTLTPAELALQCDTDPRTMRKFLRSDEGMGMKVGKGHRWAIEAKQVRSLKSKFAKWDAARNAPAPAETPEDEVETPEITDDEVEVIETLED
jgi:hypothetical protein